MGSWVTLNVGGQKFVTNTSVFMSDPECMLAKMFNGEMRPGDKDDDGAYRVASRYFFLESILMKALTCTDTAKVPLNTPKCTEKPQEMYMNVKIC